MGLRMKIFKHYGGSLKNLIFRGVTKNLLYREELPKKSGPWIACNAQV